MKSNNDSFGVKAALLAGLMALLTICVLLTVTPRVADNGFLDGLETANKSKDEESEKEDVSRSDSFKVLSVIDGDTIRIDYYGREELIRFIGVNTPEVDGPYTEAECYGNEASGFTKRMLEGEWVTIESDQTQPDRDKYGRMLRYVSLYGVDFGGRVISEGYGYEYTYDTPYEKQSSYKTLQDSAKNNHRGLWGANVCSTTPNTTDDFNQDSGVTRDYAYDESGNCNIKGNISINTGEKIYHVPGQEYYDEVKISPEYGERWFCSEEEAIAAGWRKAKNSGETTDYLDNDSGASSENSNEYMQEAGSNEAEDSAYYGEQIINTNKKSDRATKYSDQNAVRVIVFVVVFLVYLGALVLWMGLFIESLRQNEIASIIVSAILLVGTIAWLIAMVQVALF